ncbi:Protein of unknown function [Cotesia congregata]|uniref:Uncharacterized protein n=1 Tax=Cotesia congregata TaxID=51543 RepID=A0A8J2HK06_COTCN|nr:Protein of unknown function [Cotesia congregata]
MSRLTTKTSRVFGKSSPTKTKTTTSVSDNNNLRVKIWNSDTMQFEISIADGIAASATSNCHQTVTTILKQTPLQRSDCYETENISPAITIHQPIFDSFSWNIQTQLVIPKSTCVNLSSGDGDGLGRVLCLS